jgi:hypothetical protein
MEFQADLEDLVGNDSGSNSSSFEVEKDSGSLSSDNDELSGKVAKVTK